MAGMDLTHILEVRHLRAFSVSILVVKHFSGEYEQGEPQIKAYAARRDNALFFEFFELNGMENNSRTDVLSRLTSSKTQNLTGSIYLFKVKVPWLDKNVRLEIH